MSQEKVPFVHLHNHSHYSIGDSISSISHIFSMAQKNNMKAVALTDHGNMFGAADFFLESRQFPDVKPIIGCEIYLTPYDMESRNLNPSIPNYHHLILLAKDETGFKNLSQMVSLSFTKGFYYKPRVDKKTLETYSKGLIASSACLGGEIPSLILKGNLQEAEKRSLYFQDVFGKDNFFLEIMNHGIDKQMTVAKEIISLSQKTNVPLIATNDVHYPYQEDSETHDIFLCASSGKKLSESQRRKYDSDQFYFKNYQEMQEAMKDFPAEALTNTGHIADRCDYFPKLGEFQIPNFETPNQESNMDFLINQCSEEFAQKYPQGSEFYDEAKIRLEYELSIIKKMGFASYFLIVQDFILYAKNNGIAVGPGRGSAAGSIVAYLLQITNLNPLKYGLLFERFLNPGRISMPDIDTDFDDKKRDDVIAYVTNKYGSDRVAQIVTFGRMKAKMVIRDVGRVLDIPLSHIDTLAKLIPTFTTLAKTYDEVPEFKATIESNETFQKLYKHSLKLENIVRHTSVHAAGIIIGKTPLPEVVPLYQDKKTETIVTQFEGKYLEEYGLLKMDFLGLRNLRILKNTLALIKERHQVEIDFDKIPLDDKKTYKIFQQGKGMGVFQCESPGIKELMKKLSPSCFEDIIALLALYRPGPLNSGMAANFVKNKKNSQKIKLPHPDLANVLNDTYGVIVYQEQIMEISRLIAGFSLADADNLRKAMGKKDIKTMASLKEAFVAGAEAKNYDTHFAQKLFQDMEKFAEYGFNKSHSAAYALISYQTAYLKAHYPLEYMCCVLNAENATIDNLTKYLKECHELGIRILPPNINHSFLDFHVEENAIRFGFEAIKNIGGKILEAIIVEREKNGVYSSLMDFLSRTKSGRKILENFCIAGALDDVIPNRATLLSNVDKILQFIIFIKQDRKSGMGDLFGEDTMPEKDVLLTEIPEMDFDTLLQKEKESLGFYASGHPLEKWVYEIKAVQSYTTAELKDLKDSLEDDSEGAKELSSKKFVVAGRLINEEIKMTKKNQEMALYTFEDIDSDLPLVVFPYLYQRCKKLLQTKKPVAIECSLDISRLNPQLIAEKIELLEDNSFPIQAKRPRETPIKKEPTSLVLTVNSEKMGQSDIADLKKMMGHYKGLCEVILELDGKKLQLGKNFLIEKNSSLIEELKTLPYIKSITF